MTEHFDPWTVLGVPEGSNIQVVNSAYRRIARQLHPDMNPDPDAHRQLLAVTSARDAALRWKPTQPRPQQPGDASPDRRSSRQAWFNENLYERGFSVSKQEPFIPKSGILHIITTEPHELVHVIALPSDTPCTACSHTGAAPGSIIKDCPNCKGTGGTQHETCAVCAGTGQYFTKPCTKCNGTTREPCQKTITIPCRASEAIRVPGLDLNLYLTCRHD